MEFLVYQSLPLVAPASEQADRIVATSIRNNRKVGLTGFLHHEPRLFVHYLEGPADALDAAWRRILTDSRHRGAALLGSGPAAHRLFDGWCMGYSDDGTAHFLDFLAEAAGKAAARQATALEAIWFLRGACQRLDLGLTA